MTDVRTAFRAGFLAVCAKKGDAASLEILTRVWSFDGIAAADLEPEAFAAWMQQQPAQAAQPSKGVVCPFCNEDDFDLVGLKLHLMQHCENYQATEARPFHHV